jgi:mRNA-degrading endonuclease RelE of RelBE toxin-antitoxin system
VPRRSKFDLIFAPVAIEHMNAIDREHHPMIRQTIDDQLRYAPDRQTRNRKPLESPAPFGATWELRFGSNNRFRVFYEIDEKQNAVNILAIGTKDRNRLLIAGEEFK